MTTTVCRQIYAVLIGALLLAVNLNEADSFTIPSDAVRGFESHESSELLSSDEDHLKMITPFQQRRAHNGQATSRHSDEYDDSSEFRSVLVAQAARTPMTGTVGQMTGTPTAKVHQPVSFHSDEHDDFSDEVRFLPGILGPNKQVVSATPNAGSHPSGGHRITKRPDKRFIVSAQPGKQAIIRTVTIHANGQTTPTGKAILSHSDEHDDYSDEIVSKVSVLANRPVNNVPARMAIPAGLGQTAYAQHPIYRLRPGGHADLPWREHDDDIHVQIDPITKQVVNIRVEQKDSIEHDDLFSDELLRSHIVVSPTPALNSSPANLNAGLQTAANVNAPLTSQPSIETAGQIVNKQNGQVRPAVPTTAQPNIIGGHVIIHSDEIDDISLEDLPAGSVIQISATGGSVVAPPATGGVNLFRDSDEHDVSLEDVIAAHHRLRNGQGHTTHGQQGVPFLSDSDERDLSSEALRRILNQQNGKNLTTANRGVHLVNDSDEYDDKSVEIILNVRNGTASGQGTLLIRKSGKVVGIDRSPRTGLNAKAPAKRGAHLISRYSDEHDDSIEIVSLVRKTAVTPAETTVIGGHGIRHSDEVDDDSLELHHIERQSPTANDPALTTSDVQQHFRHSDEHDVSLEDLIGAPNQPKNGQIQAASVQQDGRFLGDSDEHHDLRERAERVFKHQGAKINITVDLSRDSDEYNDLSLEVNASLLPEIQRLLTSERSDTMALAAVQEQGVAAYGGSPGNPVVRKAKELEVRFELEDILANSLFQQKIQEIDKRLKSAPDARGKRLIEKYAEALALTSPSFNAAPAMIQSSFYLPFLFISLLVWFS